MVRGYYSAASGILSKQKAIDTISNNIANTSVAGYKSQSTVESSFGDHLVSRVSGSSKIGQNNIGPGSFMTVNGDLCTDFTQGALEPTGRSVDLAIRGEGFFLVKSEKYGEVLTRNGQAELDSDGNLILPGIGKMLNEGGREINLKSSGFTVAPDGTIYEDGRESDKLYIALPKENTALRKVGNGEFAALSGYEKADDEAFNVAQGFIEKSNVNIAKELSRIIAEQSHFQSCSQVLKIYDKINELGVNRIGSID